MNASISAIAADTRGLLMDCPQCGRRNRAVYERLGHAFRCASCKHELPQPGEPIDIESEPVFRAVTDRSVVPVLIDFWAPWCGPCKMVAPELVKVAAAGSGKWLVGKVNTENLPEISSAFGISAIPTLALFQGGRELGRQAGAMPAPAIMQFIRQFAPV